MHACAVAYIYIYVGIYVCICACTCTFTCTCICMCRCLYVCVCVEHIHIHITCVYVYSTQTFTNMNSNVCVCLHAYIFRWYRCSVPGGPCSLSIDLAPLSTVCTVLFAAFRAQVWASHFAGVAGPGLRAAVATQLRRLFAQKCVCVRVYQSMRLLVPG